MHAEHADDSELNELSGCMIGCAFTLLGRGFWKWSMRPRWPMKAMPPAYRLCNNTAPRCILCNASIIRNRWSATLPAAEYRQAAPGDQTRGPWPINRAGWRDGLLQGLWHVGDRNKARPGEPQSTQNTQTRRAFCGAGATRLSRAQLRSANTGRVERHWRSGAHRGYAARG